MLETQNNFELIVTADDGKRYVFTGYARMSDAMADGSIFGFNRDWNVRLSQPVLEVRA